MNHTTVRFHEAADHLPFREPIPSILTFTINNTPMDQRHREVSTNYNEELEQAALRNSLRTEALTLLTSALAGYVSSEMHAERDYVQSATEQRLSGIVYSEPDLQAGKVAGFRSRIDIGIEYLAPNRRMTLAPEGIADRVFTDLGRRFDPPLIQQLRDDIAHSVVKREIEEVQHLIDTSASVMSDHFGYTLHRPELELLKASLESLLPEHRQS